MDDYKEASFALMEIDPGHLVKLRNIVIMTCTPRGRIHQSLHLQMLLNPFPKDKF